MCRVEAVADHFQFMIRDCHDVAFPRQPSIDRQAIAEQSAERDRARRLVFSTVSFCQREDGSQNHVCVPIPACRCDQLTNPDPRSRVID